MGRLIWRAIQCEVELDTIIANENDGYYWKITSSCMVYNFFDIYETKNCSTLG